MLRIQLSYTKDSVGPTFKKIWGMETKDPLPNIQEDFWLNNYQFLALQR